MVEIHVSVMKQIGIKYMIYILALTLGSVLLDTIVIENDLMVLVFALALLLINMIIKPLLLLISLPITAITFGVFSLVINAWMIMLADKFVTGIYVDGFLSALLIGIFILVMKETAHIFKNKKHINV